MESYNKFEDGQKKDSTATTVALISFCLMMIWGWLPMVLAIVAMAIPPLVAREDSKNGLESADELGFEERSNLFVSRFNFGIMGSI